MTRFARELFKPAGRAVASDSVRWGRGRMKAPVGAEGRNYLSSSRIVAGSFVGAWQAFPAQR